METDTLIEVTDLRKWYRAREDSFFKSLFGDPSYLKAVDDVTFEIERGEILGLAGQSGCGKSTLGELLLRLENPSGGTITFDGEDVTEFGKSALKDFRQRAQMIFQDPYEALNPRYPVVRTLTEPLTIHGITDQSTQQERVHRALEDAGLSPPEKYLSSLPSDLSGGERQRVCIARALVLEPDFIVADEPVSMLDVSVRTGILKLFKELQENRNLTMLYISHDLSTINYLADRTMIMYLGNAVEIGSTAQVIRDPAHPYTETLLDAVPTPDPDDIRSGSSLGGEVPDPINLPAGCRFKPSCPYATEVCSESEPPLDEYDVDGRRAACYHPVTE